MLVQTIKICPLEEVAHFEGVNAVKLQDTAGNNLFQLLNSLFYVQPLSIINYLVSLVDLKGRDENKIEGGNPLEKENLENFVSQMKFYSMQEFIFTVLNLSEVELSSNDVKLKKRQENILEKFYDFT